MLPAELFGQLTCAVRAVIIDNEDAQVWKRQ
jgi:hypothetical protein